MFFIIGDFFLRLAFLFFVMVNLLFLRYPGIAIPDATKVAMLPFQMNADEDIEYLNKGIMEMLVSRITYGSDVSFVEQYLVKDAMSKEQAGKLTKEKAQAIGDALGAEYVIFGSVSKIGNNLSMDVHVLNVLQDGITIPAFTQSVGLDEVIPKIEILAQDVRGAISTGFRDLLPQTTTVMQPPVSDGAFIKGDSGVDDGVPVKIEEFDLTGSDVKADKPESTYEEVFPEIKKEDEPLGEDPSDSNRLREIFLERKSEVDSLDENPVYQKSVDDLEKNPAAEQK